MQGWLVVNGFIEKQKFNSIYAFLQNAAKRFSITLEIKNTRELVCALDDELCELSSPDFVLFWDKDVYLARRLEQKGIKLFNSRRAIEICDNKILTALALKGVKTPKTIIAPKTFEGVGYNKTDFIEKSAEILGTPFIIKEAYGSFGQQVYLANDIAEAKKIVEGLGHKEFLMQEFIKESRGRDARLNVVGGRVVSAMMRQNENDFRSNVSNGGKTFPFTPSEEMKALAIKACEIIGLDFAGVDLLFGEEPMLCEVNSNPHFESTFDCTGLDMSIDIMEYINDRLLNLQ